MLEKESKGRFRYFSRENPLLFALAITILLLLLYILAVIAALVWGNSIAASNFIEATGRLFGSLLLVTIPFQIPLVILGWAIISRTKPRSALPRLV